MNHLFQEWFAPTSLHHRGPHALAPSRPPWTASPRAPRCCYEASHDWAWCCWSVTLPAAGWWFILARQPWDPWVGLWLWSLWISTIKILEITIYNLYIYIYPGCLMSVIVGFKHEKKVGIEVNWWMMVGWWLVCGLSQSKIWADLSGAPPMGWWMGGCSLGTVWR